MTHTKNELLFMRLALTNCDGVFDFDNVTKENWKDTYGMTYKEAIKVLENLRLKVDKALGNTQVISTL